MSPDEFERDERVIRLRFLHEAHSGSWGSICPECSDPENGLHVVWPCMTVRTLDGERNWWNTPDELSTLATTPPPPAGRTTTGPARAGTEKTL